MESTALKVALTIDCPSCRGQGGWFEDRWSYSTGHYTADFPCDACAGSGIADAVCAVCGGHAEFFDSEEYVCHSCDMECNSDPDRILTVPDGVPVTMSDITGVK